MMHLHNDLNLQVHQMSGIGPIKKICSLNILYANTDLGLGFFTSKTVATNM